MTELEELDCINRGAIECARKLEHIALHGRTSGVFGGPEIERAAQAILALRARAEAAERRVENVDD